MLCVAVLQRQKMLYYKHGSLLSRLASTVNHVIGILIGNDRETRLFGIASGLGVGERKRHLHVAQRTSQDVCAGVVKREAKRGAMRAVKSGFSHMVPPFLRFSGVAPLCSIPQEQLRSINMGNRA